jgi:branched-chain amino acid transport system substrate-binding protein
MYKTLVEKAKSIKLDDMRKVIATGEACIDAPEGQVCIDPKSQHTSHRMRLISVGPQHEVKVEKDYGTIKPYWLGEIGCDLTKKNDKDQYTPNHLPKKS